MRRGSTSSVRYRRAMMLLASADGNRVPVIAQLVRADEDTVRDVIHKFNEIGLPKLCFTPTYASWANPIEAHFGPLRQFTLANSHHPHHTVRTSAPHAYLRRRNANACHRHVLVAERKERARIRSDKGIRWGGRPFRSAA